MNHVPNTTQVGIAPTRLPPTIRTRLAGWCKLGIDFCSKVGAPRVGQLIQALELALLDLDAAELRLQQLERRARKAERELADARATIEDLRQEAARAAAAEFVAEPTLVRPDADPIVARCRTVEGS